MARSDYRLCDVCDGKAFYDANLNYEHGPSEYRPDEPPYRVAGDEQYPNTPEFTAKYGMRLDYVGDWAVICTDCARTHRTAILPREGSECDSTTTEGRGPEGAEPGPQGRAQGEQQ
jgi:hypothetical protein